MTAVVTFTPLSDSEHQFERVDIELRVQEQVYIVGFRQHPLAHSRSDGGTGAGLTGDASLADRDSAEGDSDVTRDGERNFSVRKNSVRSGTVAGFAADPDAAGKMNDVGFSEKVVDDKLCIVPADSSGARKVRDVYAAIWLAPGYKVMLLSAEGTKVYYQRAVPGNAKWKRIKQGYGVDLADPLMTVLDDAIHIKIDIRPNKPTTGVELLRRALRFIRRTEPAAQPSYPPSLYTVSPFPYFHHPLVRHIHIEIEGTETHDRPRPHQIAARVSVVWNDIRGERMKEEVEKGEFKGLRKEREKVWKKREMEMENVDRMEVDINPFVDSDSESKLAQKKAFESSNQTQAQPSPPPLSPTAFVPPTPPTSPAGEPQLPPIPEDAHAFMSDTTPSPTATRPTSGRSKSNTTKSPPQSRESRENKDSQSGGRNSQTRARSPSLTSSSGRRASKN